LRTSTYARDSAARDTSFLGDGDGPHRGLADADKPGDRHNHFEVQGPRKRPTPRLCARPSATPAPTATSPTFPFGTPRAPTSTPTTAYPTYCPACKRRGAQRRRLAPLPGAGRRAPRRRGETPLRSTRPRCPTTRCLSEPTLSARRTGRSPTPRRPGGRCRRYSASRWPRCLSAWGALGFTFKQAEAALKALDVGYADAIARGCLSLGRTGKQPGAPLSAEQRRTFWQLAAGGGT
jgi:hypothetical protein